MARVVVCDLETISVLILLRCENIPIDAKEEDKMEMKW